MPIRTLLYLFSLCLSTFPAMSQTKMSPEELTVRNAYAKLAYAVKIQTVHNMVTAYQGASPATSYEVREKLANEELRFSISNFSVHSVNDSSLKYSEIVTKPTGDILSVSMGTLKMVEGGTTTQGAASSAYWRKGPDGITENWDVPANEALAQVENAKLFSKYAAYTVTVTFHGKSRTYNAVFLFGTDNGKEVYLPIDTITGNSALLHFATTRVYPDTLVKTSLKHNPVVSDWLRSEGNNCSAKEDELCCDASTISCSVPSREIPTSSLREKKAELQPVSLRISPQIAAQSQNCGGYNFNARPGYVHNQNNNAHITGWHDFYGGGNGICLYGGTGTGDNPIVCHTQATAQSAASMDESGVVSSSCHVDGTAVEAAVADAVGPATASVQSAGAVQACLFCGCSVSVSIGPLGISFPSPNVWTSKFAFQNACPQRRAGGPGTPIIIDTTGEGFPLTSDVDGVTIDFFATGSPVRMSWTAKDSHLAFLLMFRSPEAERTGKVTGYDLFGNLTPQPTSDSPDGFKALAVLDQADHGGNGDGMISPLDKAWSKLWGWIDSNHDGIVQPGELHHLEELGVYSIGLKDTLTPMIDRFGNKLRYKGTINLAGNPTGDNVDRTIYDVVFVIDTNRGIYRPVKDGAYMLPRD